MSARYFKEVVLGIGTLVGIGILLSLVSLTQRHQTDKIQASSLHPDDDRNFLDEETMHLFSYSYVDFTKP